MRNDNPLHKPYTRFTEADLLKVLQLREQGYTIREIAEITLLCKRTISRWLEVKVK